MRLQTAANECSVLLDDYSCGGLWFVLDDSSSGFMWEQENSKIPNGAKAIAPLDSSSKTHIDCVSGDTWQFLRIKNISLSCLNRICQLFVFFETFLFLTSGTEKFIYLSNTACDCKPCILLHIHGLSAFLSASQEALLQNIYSTWYLLPHRICLLKHRWQRHNQLFVFLFFFYRKQKHDLKNFSFALWYVFFKRKCFENTI